MTMSEIVEKSMKIRLIMAYGDFIMMFGLIRF